MMEECGNPENPPRMEEIDLENDVYEELVETTVEEDEPMPAPAAPVIRLRRNSLEIFNLAQNG